MGEHSAIAQDEPGFSDNFRPPKTSSQVSLLTSADAFLLQFQEQPGQRKSSTCR